MYLAEVLIPISFFSMIFGVIYLFFSTRHKERLMLIEKGADADIFFPERKSKTSSTSRVLLLSLSLIAIGIGLGIFTSYTLITVGLDPDYVMPGCVFLFAGIGLFSAIHMIARMEKQESVDF